MKTKSIDLMLSRPGLYVVLSPNTAFVVEVEPGGACWQVSMVDGSRACKLPEGQWLVANISAILGPFALLK